MIEHPDAVEQLSKDKEFMELFGAFQKLSRYKAVLVLSAVENISYSGMGAPLIGRRAVERQSAVVMEDLGNLRAFNIPPKTARLYPKAIRPGDAYSIEKGDVMDKIRTVYCDSAFYPWR
jgi:hypothetical protein